ncbi:hypothetical protein JHK87_012276 [Glycine soja]|nr:hypothetical protein JHK87_012276 [Glycine soja]
MASMVNSVDIERFERERKGEIEHLHTMLQLNKHGQAKRIKQRAKVEREDEKRWKKKLVRLTSFGEVVWVGVQGSLIGFWRGSHVKHPHNRIECPARIPRQLFKKKRAFQVQAHVIKCGLACDVFVGTSLLHFYGTFGWVAEVDKVFKEIEEPNIMS